MGSLAESAKRVAEKKDWIKGATGDWEIIIGLEVHAQISSKAKLFSGASAEYGGDQNDHGAGHDPTDVPLVRTPVRRRLSGSMETRAM